MRKLIMLVIIVAVIIMAKNSLDWLGKKAKEEDEVTKTIQRIDWTKEKLTGLDTHFIQTQITAFVMTFNRRPNSLQEMVDQNYLTTQGITDPWGNAYQESWTEKELVLTSKGEDHVTNTPDDQTHRIPIGSF